MTDMEIILTCNEPLCRTCSEVIYTAKNQLELISKLTELIRDFSHYDCSVRVKL